MSLPGDDITVQPMIAVPLPTRLIDSGWKVPTPGFLLELSGWPKENYAHLCHMLAHEDKAGIRVGMMFGEEGEPEILFLVFLGEPNDKRPQHGIHNPFYQVVMDDQHSELAKVVAKQEEKWSLGVAYENNVFVVYVDDTDVVDKQAWSVDRSRMGGVAQPVDPPPPLQ